jgi:hypothetical protein
MVQLLPATGGGRIIAISYSPNGRTGSVQPWAAMGAAKDVGKVRLVCCSTNYRARRSS